MSIVLKKDTSHLILIISKGVNANKPIQKKPGTQSSRQADSSDNVERNWFGRLKAGLSKTRNHLIGQIGSLLRSGNPIDEDLLDEIEAILIQANSGVDTTSFKDIIALKPW